jgi:hypothetical protein
MIWKHMNNALLQSVESIFFARYEMFLSEKNYIARYIENFQNDVPMLAMQNT